MIYCVCGHEEIQHAFFSPFKTWECLPCKKAWIEQANISWKSPIPLMELKEICRDFKQDNLKYLEDLYHERI